METCLRAGSDNMKDSEKGMGRFSRERSGFLGSRGSPEPVSLL